MLRKSAFHGSVLALSMILLGACTDATSTAPSLDDAQYNRKGGASPAAPPYVWTLPGTTTGLSADGKGDYIGGQCGVTGQVYYGASNDATLSVDAAGKKCARTVGIRYPGASGFRTVGMFINLTQAAAIPSGVTMKRRLILNPGQFNGSDACGRIIFGVGGTNNIGAGSDSVVVTRVGNSWSVSGSALLGWCEKQNVLIANDVNFTIVNN